MDVVGMAVPLSTFQCCGRGLRDGLRWGSAPYRWCRQRARRAEAMRDKHPDSETEDEYIQCQANLISWYEDGHALVRLAGGGRCTAQSAARQDLMDCDAERAVVELYSSGQAHLCLHHGSQYLKAMAARKCVVEGCRQE